jgi:hypothetical protein
MAQAEARALRAGQTGGKLALGSGRVKLRAPASREAVFENPAGESVDRPVRLDFDRRAKLEFDGSRVAS